MDLSRWWMEMCDLCDSYQVSRDHVARKGEEEKSLCCLRDSIYILTEFAEQDDVVR